jgi:glucose/arabinose dehydrogenase
VPAPFLTAPSGFHVSVINKHVPGARYLAVAPNGDILVAQTPAGSIVVIHPGSSPDDRPEEFDVGISLPHGMAFFQGRLYVATWFGAVRYDYPAQHPTVLFDDLPKGGVHDRRALAIAGDGTLFVSSGSNCNVCDERDARFATIVRYVPPEKQSTIYARGLRNASGLAFDATGRLWATVNQRDNIGPTQAITDNLPPDEFDLIAQDADYGWPQCYPDPSGARRLPNPEHPRADCSRTRPATFNIPAHSAPLGVVFYEGELFPLPYHGDAFIALHGSWNRSKPSGDKVVVIDFASGKPVGMRDFVTGWMDDHGDYRGRPVGLAVGPDGALYISDDKLGWIYRVWYGP